MSAPANPAVRPALMASQVSLARSFAALATNLGDSIAAQSCADCADCAVLVDAFDHLSCADELFARWLGRQNNAEAELISK